MPFEPFELPWPFADDACCASCEVTFCRLIEETGLENVKRTAVPWPFAPFADPLLDVEFVDDEFVDVELLDVELLDVELPEVVVELEPFEPCIDCELATEADLSCIDSVRFAFAPFWFWFWFWFDDVVVVVLPFDDEPLFVVVGCPLPPAAAAVPASAPVEPRSSAPAVAAAILRGSLIRGTLVFRAT